MPASDDTRPWPDEHNRGGGFFPPSSSARKVSGGIRLTRAKPRSWWARRWLAVFEALAPGDRLQRGLAYAKGGQVLRLDVGVARVTATVQGSRREPHEVTIELDPIEQGDWLRIADAFAAQVGYRAALLTGEMPEDAEAVCARAGVRLFPGEDDEVRTVCACDDWANPCRHVSAVCFLLAEAIDADPLLVFQLRGIERDVLTTLVAGRGATATETEPDADEAPANLVGEHFWSVPDDGRPAPLDLEPPAIDAPLVQILGAPAHWQASAGFETSMERILGAASRSARVVDVALGYDPNS